MNRFIRRVVQPKSTADPIEALNTQITALEAQHKELSARYEQFQQRYNADLTHLQASYWALENYRVELQSKHYDLLNYVHTLEKQIQDRLRHLESVVVPATAHFYSAKAVGKPIIFEDSDHLLFECDALNRYLSFIDANSVINDPQLVQYIKRVVQQGETIVDVGANIGGIALLCGKLVRQNGRVFAIEAEANNVELLRHNIVLNHMEAWVTGIHAAAYSSNKTLTLNVFGREAGAWNTLGYFELDYAPVGTQQVDGITLDDFCMHHAIEEIDLLKVDVEGAEPEVFAGAKGLLSRQAARRIVFEISKVPMEGMGHQVEDITQPLLDAGYSLYQLAEQGKLQPLDIAQLKNTYFGNFIALPMPESHQA